MLTLAARRTTRHTQDRTQALRAAASAATTRCLLAAAPGAVGAPLCPGAAQHWPQRHSRRPSHTRTCPSHAAMRGLRSSIIATPADSARVEQRSRSRPVAPNSASFSHLPPPPPVTLPARRRDRHITGQARPASPSLHRHRRGHRVRGRDPAEAAALPRPPLLRGPLSRGRGHRRCPLPGHPRHTSTHVHTRRAAMEGLPTRRTGGLWGTHSEARESPDCPRA